MATQSSVAVACRALVMLASLVAIPLVAAFGGAVPEQLRTLVTSYLPAVASSFAGEQREPARFQPTHAAAIDPAVAAGQLARRPDSYPTPQPQAYQEVAPQTHSAVVSAGYEVPVALKASRGSAAAPVVSAARQLPVERQPDQTRPMPAPLKRQSADPFTAMQTRLQELGATYVLLESMGNTQEVYRCYCRVAIGNDPSYAYYFEAIHSAPLEAMARVLSQVEQWRARRP